MRIIVRNRHTGEIVLDLDVNKEGNVHDLILEERASRFEVEGLSWSNEIRIEAKHEDRSGARMIIEPISESVVTVACK